MNAKRKKIQDHICKIMDILDPSGINSKRYADNFANMGDNEFAKFMDKLKDGSLSLYIYVPNMKNELTMRSIIEASKAIGFKSFERVYMKDKVTGKTYLTNHKYMILKLPIRRVKQFLMEKLSVPDGDTKTDLLSGQVIKPDKGSSISLIEMQTLNTKGLDRTILEFMKVRGGDNKAYAAFKSKLEETGEARIEDIDPTTSPRSIVIASTYLKAMHIDNNLQE